MRTLLTLLALLLLVTVNASAQSLVADGRSYAAAYDTTSTFEVPGGDLALAIWFKDSANVKIVFDYAPTTGAPWATWDITGADSTNSVAGAGVVKTYTVRRASTNNVPAAVVGRLRIQRLSTKNGVTTPTYNAYLRRD